MVSQWCACAACWTSMHCLSSAPATHDAPLALFLREVFSLLRRLHHVLPYEILPKLSVRPFTRRDLTLEASPTHTHLRGRDAMLEDAIYAPMAPNLGGLTALTRLELRNHVYMAPPAVPGQSCAVVPSQQACADATHMKAWCVT